MSVAFSRRRLEWLVRSLGTDLARWPALERRAVLDLLRRSPEAQAVFAEALALDDDVPHEVLDTDRAVFNRIQVGLRRHLAPLSTRLRGLCVGALIACVAAGLYLGIDTEAPDASDLFNSAQTVTFAALDQ